VKRQKVEEGHSWFDNITDWIGFSLVNAQKTGAKTETSLEKNCCRSCEEE